MDNVTVSLDENSGSPSISGIRAIFCPLQWQIYQENPPMTSMFIHLIYKSNCSNNNNNQKNYNHSLLQRRVEVDLGQVLKVAYAHDRNEDDSKTFPKRGGDGGDSSSSSTISTTTQLLDWGGFVFHQSRCGSTWVSNMLTAMNPSNHYVYSEPGPPAHVVLRGLKDGLLTRNDTIVVLRHVLYLMRRRRRRRREGKEESYANSNRKLFVKWQSTMTRYLDVFQQAFNENDVRVPTIFLYRDSIPIMMSYLKDAKISNSGHNDVDEDDWKRHAHCQGGAVRGLPSLSNPPLSIQAVLKRRHIPVQNLTFEGYCAANLATVTEPVLEYAKQKKNASSLNSLVLVNYEALPDQLYQIWQRPPWNLTVGPAELDRLRRVSLQYSKGLRSHRRSRHADFQDDSKTKRVQAWPQVRKAAHLFLDDTYQQLEQLFQQQQQQQQQTGRTRFQQQQQQ